MYYVHEWNVFSLQITFTFKIFATLPSLSNFHLHFGMSKSRKSFPGMIVPLIIRRWHKINIPNTSRPSAMTHGMMKRKREKPCQKPFPSFYPVMIYALLLLLHQLREEKEKKEPFLFSEDDIHPHALKHNYRVVIFKWN